MEPSSHASELVIEGSGYGTTKKEAFFAAATDAIWKVLYEEIGTGADEKEEQIRDWVQKRLEEDRNKYIANHRFKSIKEDPVLEEIHLTGDFTVKTNRIAQLSKEVFDNLTASDSVNQIAGKPTIMFLFKDMQLEAAFTQEFIDKGLNVLSHEQAIARFEAAKEDARQEAEEEKQVMEWLGAVKEDNGESLARENAIKMANFLKADYFVKGSYDIEKKGQDKMGRLQVMFNLINFEVYSSKGRGQIVAKVQNMVYADGTTYGEAIKLSKKKAAVVLVKEAFQQIISNWNSK
jgi:hypothetical protein